MEQQSPNSNEDFENKKNLIYFLDLNGVIEYLQKKLGWSYNEALSASQLYRNYLYLLLKYKNLEIPPSYDINEAWEAHILYNTQTYNNFINSVFNEKSLPHRNYFYNKKFIRISDQTNFENITKNVYKKEFLTDLDVVKKSSFLLKLKNLINRHYRYLTGSVVTMMLAAILSHIVNNYSLVKETSNKIKDALREVSIVDERTFILCNDKKNKNNPLYTKILYDLWMDRQKKLTEFLELIKNSYDNDLITEDAYKRLYIYSNKNNQIFNQGIFVCDTKLMNLDQIHQDRVDLLDKIDKSEKIKKLRLIY